MSKKVGGVVGCELSKQARQWLGIMVKILFVCIFMSDTCRKNGFDCNVGTTILPYAALGSMEKEKCEITLCAQNTLYKEESQTSCSPPYIKMLDGSRAALHLIKHVAGSQGDIMRVVFMNTPMLILRLYTFRKLFRKTKKIVPTAEIQMLTVCGSFSF